MADLPASSSTSLDGLRCLTCGYELTGLIGRKCPECGSPIDPLANQSHQSAWRRWLIAAIPMFIAYYAPYGWLLWLYPWRGNDAVWLRMWGGLPLLSIGEVIGVRRWLESNLNTDVDNTGGLLIYTTASLGALVGLTWLASRGRRWLLAIGLTVLALSALNSWCLYHLYLM